MRGSDSARAVRAIVAAAALLLTMSFSIESRSSLAQSRSSAATTSTTGSKTFDSLAKSADEARDAGRLDDAVKLYRRALTLNPKWAEGWWSLGTLYYDSDRYAEAQLAFGKVVALDPKQGTARAMLGLCEFELGQPERALKDIEASKTLGVLEDKQLRDVVMYHDGVLLQRAGQFEAAKAALSSLCLNGVRSAELAGTFGMVALRMRDAAAPDASTEAGDVVQHAGRAACLNAAKEYEAAKTEFDQVIARAPHFPLLHYAYGCALVDARDIPGAVKEFEAEIAEQPKSVFAASAHRGGGVQGGFGSGTEVCRGSGATGSEAAAGTLPAGAAAAGYGRVRARCSGIGDSAQGISAGGKNRPFACNGVCTCGPAARCGASAS